MAITGTAAGVPFVALEPAGVEGPAPLVVTWHLMDAPRTEAAMAAALPMNDLPAWRVYLGLPMSGKRALPGGDEEYFGLAMQDAVLNVYGPTADQAATEFPAAVAELREQLSIADGPVYVAGGSAGSMVAYEVVTRGEVEIAAAAVVSPVTQLAPLIAANERRFEITYTWSGESREVAERYDFVRRADEITVPLLIVVGENDDIAVREPAALGHKAIAESELVTIPGMEHALADEDETAPRTEDAKRVDAEFTRWFAQYIQG
ncbi:alpha/beta hydrolase family protein [Kibdelosporangium phytohabitans]|uniref:Peptidase n=1 Tax=Kibdelosporangium phytohabitans TaxID=860235 RepID=A0A0N9I3N7_9PSEU|nr:prolyl oligopeptidase family serine peptidase [Kibdelosporangium phytohabitans]ALG12467.1 peptidase [Kibdelosporangium phytohabitans]MBE1464060.1 alpha-beta hydrolase superfamily lysophospholipase [Kibdelosporangium phytohabitans]